MKFLLQQKLYTRLVLSKYEIPMVGYSSLRPSTVKDNPNDSFPYTGPRTTSIKVKPKREPFLKNLLNGKFDMEMIAYPEVLDLERLKNIDKMSEVLNKFWLEEVNPNPEYFKNGLPPDFLTNMTNFGLCKQKIPYVYSGLELTATESAKVIEITGKNLFSYNYLSGQNIVQHILSMASDSIKDKYYNDIVKNNLKGAVCLSESHAEFDVRLGNTKLTWSDADKKYVLNGQKIWVANADIADFFIVFGNFNGSSVFLVDKKKPGITINEHMERGYFIVEFKDTPLEESDVITKPGLGLEVSSKIQSLSMFYFSSGVVGLLKEVFDCTTQYIMFRPFLQKYCSDSEATQVSLSKIATAIYALEGMVYFTANLIDGYEGQDYEVEMAVLKLFASQVSQNVVGECINLLGPHVTMHSYQYPFLETLQTLQRLSHLNVSDDIVKLFVAIKCIEYNKPNFTEYIKKIRSPYIYVNEGIKHQMYLMRNEKDQPKLDLNINYNLHPSLKSCADILEYSIKRLEYANILLLQNYGAETYDHHYSLHRITNILTDIYAMTTTLARASRSYCTGIENCDSEIISAHLFCHRVQKSVKANVKEIEDGQYNDMDYTSKKLADKILDVKGYYAQHPLARNIV